MNQSINNKNITIVSAYFEIHKSKFDHDKYMSWIKNFMQIRSNIVIFTNCKEKLQHLRPIELHIHYIDTTLDDFYTNKYDWIKHHQMDHEKAVHSIELYMIWNEKSNFIKRAIDINPFNTDYFYWTDIGAFRNSQLNDRYANYPIKKVDKIVLLNIEHFTMGEILIDGIDSRFQHKNRIGGGIFGGHKDKCLEWWLLYYKMLDTFFDKNIFAGKDQSIMAFVYLNNKELVELVRPSQNYLLDPWFYLEDYLID